MHRQVAAQPSRPEVVSFDTNEWKRGYETQDREEEYWIENIEGHIPLELQGTFFQNIPAKFDIGNERIKHPFDGDGMIVEIIFKDGKAYFRNRYVQTEGYLKEKEANKILFRNTFGTQRAGGPLANVGDTKQKNVANTNVLYWGDRLLALWEGSQPHALDPNSLATIGVDNLNGLLRKGEMLMTGIPFLDEQVIKGGRNFTAHPHIDANTGRLVGFGVQTGPSGSLVRVYEFESDFHLKQLREFEVPGFAFFHDFCLTEKYYVFFQNPVTIAPLMFLLGFKGAAECIEFDPARKTKIYLIPREGDISAGIRVLDADPCFIFHFVNAYDDGDNNIVVDAVRASKLQLGDSTDDFRNVDWESLVPSRLHRYNINTTTGQVDERPLHERPAEFPSVHPNVFGKKHSVIFSGAGGHPTRYGPLQVVLKKDLTSGQEVVKSFGSSGFIGEPVFVPKPGSQAEDDGWLLVLVFDGSTTSSSLVIVDAKSMEQVARLKLKYFLPYGLHGSFTPKTFAPL
eukprot:CAMPEP_0184670442 /NCGR_PEP_ID=MMETSP0308-20130426/82202_1 /TAXON_ID=38269 /ORGANISM="Gloeochaete witrockiana, Strain SAG 46.84" /LENGTH=511 /DNA_ID=CAMNT_0027117179 /DNA_START=198 /DNA_END=1734 /DNA_ORIENTATION=+